MKLSTKQSFLLKGQNGKEAELSCPFVNDNKDLEFKFCSFFNGSAILNEEKRAIELHSKGKTVYILLNGENEALFEEVRNVKKQILLDLRQLTQSFREGKEPIYAMETGNKTYPYLITSPTVLENGLLSPKYSKGILYFVNEKAQKVGKKILLTDYEEMQKTVGKAIQKADLSKFKHAKMEGTGYYEIPLDKLIEIM